MRRARSCGRRPRRCHPGSHRVGQGIAGDRGVRRSRPRRPGTRMPHGRLATSRLLPEGSVRRPADRRRDRARGRRAPVPRSAARFHRARARAPSGRAARPQPPCRIRCGLRPREMDAPDGGAGQRVGGSLSRPLSTWRAPRRIVPAALRRGRSPRTRGAADPSGASAVNCVSSSAIRPCSRYRSASSSRAGMRFGSA